MRSKLSLLLAAAFLGTASLRAADPLDQLVDFLGQNSDPVVQLDVLRGISGAIKGRRDLPMPAGWARTEARLRQASNREVRLLAQTIGLTFGSAEAVRGLRQLVLETGAEAALRRTGLEALLTARDPGLPELLHTLLTDRELRSSALRGLARFDDPATPGRILGIYGTLSPAEKRDALNALAARASYAKPLLNAVSTGTVARNELTADLIRQLRNLKAAEVDEQLRQVWGSFRETSADKQPEIDRYKRIYRAGGSTPGDGPRGRAVFAKVCQQCHVLFDAGGNVGPEITGSNRADLDYILQNILDPNAVIPNDYRSSTINLKDDRVLTGIVKSQDANALTIATANETLTVPKTDVESVILSEVSMMPEGLLAPLTEQEVRDLLYYLGRPGQVPLPVANP